MRAMPDKCFDLAIVDPPYGIDAPNMRIGQGGGICKPGDYVSKFWDLERPSADYFEQLFRISTNQIIWGFNYLADLLPPSNATIVWDKICYDRRSTDSSDAELAWCSIGNRTRIIRYLWRGMLQGSPAKPTEFIGDLTKKEKRIHPTQKPIYLYGQLLANYAKTGDRILDTHLGSGSSRIAAYDLGFDFVGYELDKDYFDAQEERFQRHIAQPKLFETAKVVTQSALF